MSTEREKAIAAMHHAVEKHGARLVMAPPDETPSRHTPCGKLISFGELVSQRYWLERVPAAAEVALTLGGWKRITGAAWTWVDRG